MVRKTPLFLVRTYVRAIGPAEHARWELRTHNEKVFISLSERDVGHRELQGISVNCISSAYLHL